MGRVVDEEGLKKSIWEYTDKYGHIYMGITCFNILLERNRVDAEPVKHGYIVYRERYRINYGKYTGLDENGEEHTITVCENYGSGKEPYCSECGSQLAESSLNYCPRCGAKLSEINDMERLIEALKTTKDETAKGLILENYMRNHKMDPHEYAEAIRMLTSEERREDETD